MDPGELRNEQLKIEAFKDKEEKRLQAGKYYLPKRSGPKGLVQNMDRELVSSKRVPFKMLILKMEKTLPPK